MVRSTLLNSSFCKVFSSIYNRATLLLRHDRKKKARYTFAIGDIRWTRRSTFLNTIFNGFAGFFSGIFGIGGAVVTYPLMMEMRALPEVALATSNTMVFFTTGVVFLSYASLGSLEFDYGGVLVGVGCVATLCARRLITPKINEFHRISLIYFAAAFMAAASAMMMVIVAGFAYLDDDQSQQSLCTR
mmetsp:Transcript_19831/g.27909  ORF Transcript_19831/g.27909 Transcript_19831/m.27909 type:complete len:187 (+) Transcript_19831:381-941(+)